MTPESERYYVQKVTKELIKIWQQLEIKDEQVAASETLDLAMIKETLQRMGFVSEECAQDQLSLQEIWKVLGGEARGHVTLNNLRLFLLAVQNILVEHGPNIDRNNLQRLPVICSTNLSGEPGGLPEGQIGKYNKHGDLFLETADLRAIKTQFNKLSINRLQHEIRVKQ
jgi:hypothetical protein